MSSNALSTFTQRDHFTSLDGWRGICACLVALYHFTANSHLYGLPLVRNAYLFVDFFFVLSGFVIAAGYGQRLVSGSDFGIYMLRRVGRLYPLHLFVLAAWVGLELIKLLAVTNGWGSFTNRPFTGATTLESLGLNLLMLHSIGLNEALSWNYPSWSISAELLAYLGFGLLTWWLRKPWPLFACVVLFTPWLLYQLNGNMFATYDYGYLRCFLGFCIGAFTFSLFRLVEPTATKVLHSPLAGNLIELALIGLVCWFVSWVGKSPFSILAPFIFAPAVFVFAFEGGLVSKLLRSGPLVLIGALSYSIYMIHGLVQEIFKLLTLGVLPQLTHSSWAVAGEEGSLIGVNALHGDLIHISMLAAVIALSFCTYHWVELPWKRRIQQWTQHWSPLAPAKVPAPTPVPVPVPVSRPIS